MWMMYNQAEQMEQNPQATATEQPAEQPQSQSAASVIPEITDNTPLTFTNLSNEVLRLSVRSKGGVIDEAELLTETNYLDEQVFLVQNQNTDFNLRFSAEGQQYNTRDLSFTPISENNRLTMRAVVGSGYLDFVYTLPNDGYRLNFDIEANGFSTDSDAELYWSQDGFRQALSADYENRYAQLAYQYEDDKVGTLSAMGDDDDRDKDISWIAYRHHFFSMILIPEKSFKNADFISESLIDEDDSDASEFLKRFETQTNLDVRNGQLSAAFDWYIGPTDYNILKQYDENISESISFGWGIIGWINRYVFFPLFGFLSGFLPFGIAIIVMTVIVRLVLSPVTYKSYLSQAKMKVLRPEITELNEKFKKDAGRKQQETMKLYSKAGVNPMAGCVPSLLQLPVFLGLFYFFPVAFSLRGKSFLWAEDLSSYDAVLDLPFNIPFYGDHISLFPLLASIAIFFYSKMTMGQQMQSPQPGMPNMKIMIYLMPVMMLFFFNNYASGLSLYYFVSNLITIFIMLVIKNYIIDEQRIHLQIQENKKKPKKQSRFQRKMEEMMEQAEQQRRSGRRR
jgi:YidC/Oxa1 family membrane protein insertase